MQKQEIALIVPITNEDRENALYYTFQRNRTKRDAGVKDQKVDTKKGTLLIDYMGLLAEIATAKTLNTQIINNDNSLVGDEGFDLQWQGEKIQVKYTFHRSGHLLFGSANKNPHLESAIYILTWGNEHNIHLLGYITQEGALAYMEKKDFGYGLDWCVPQSKLSNVRRLIHK